MRMILMMTMVMMVVMIMIITRVDLNADRVLPCTAR